MTTLWRAMFHIWRIPAVPRELRVNYCSTKSPSQCSVIIERTRPPSKSTSKLPFSCLRKARSNHLEKKIKRNNGHASNTLKQRPIYLCSFVCASITSVSPNLYFCDQSSTKVMRYIHKNQTFKTSYLTHTFGLLENKTVTCIVYYPLTAMASLLYPFRECRSFPRIRNKTV